jgi:L-seryl-tRNA(Ser) seleniumtransferase/D-glucosaminate-6-phosphate ammonia-lyase
VNFGAEVTQLIRMAGGKPHAIGAVNAVHEAHLTGAFGPNVAAFLYIQSHHAVQKGMIPLAKIVDLCHAQQIPVLVDAAAEEDLGHFTHSGADLVTFSGGKAIGGPTSGIVAGRSDLVAACRAQNQGIGRPMKVGKEALAGLARALELYMQRNVEEDQQRSAAIVDQLLESFGKVVRTERLEDEAGRGIERAGIVLSPEKAGDFVKFLQSGTPAIHVRKHLLNLGIVAFDPRPLSEADVEIIIQRVQEYFKG